MLWKDVGESHDEGFQIAGSAMRLDAEKDAFDVVVVAKTNAGLDTEKVTMCRTMARPMWELPPWLASAYGRTRSRESRNLRGKIAVHIAGFRWDELSVGFGQANRRKRSRMESEMRAHRERSSLQTTMELQTLLMERTLAVSVLPLAAVGASAAMTRKVLTQMMVSKSVLGLSTGSGLLDHGHRLECHCHWVRQSLTRMRSTERTCACY